MTTSGGGCYGPDYDRYLDRSDDSTFGKFKQQYYTAKQAIRSKFGKKEDEFLIASDAELDAKLAVFYSVKESCENLLQCIERYQDFICELSQEENALGRFLKQHGKADKTQAGKMMAGVGRAQSFSAQQRLALRVPLVRLYQELEVFTERAVGDCGGTVEKTERARTEYRGSLLWMKKVSEELDPDTYRQLERFRKVQAQVKRKKAKFDKNKLDCLQKVDLLVASRCNLFSQLMANYQNCLLHFWDKTSSAHNTVAENFKGYQHYEFTILKDLSEPSKKLAELTAGPTNNEKKEAEPPEQAQEAILQDELISLEDDKEVRSEMERILLKDSPEGEEKLPSLFDEVPPSLAPPPPPASNLQNNAAKSGQQSVDQFLTELTGESLDDILSGGSVPEESFSFQWQKTFGKNTIDSIGESLGTVVPEGQMVGLDGSLQGSKQVLPSQLLESQMQDNLLGSKTSPGATLSGLGQTAGMPLNASAFPTKSKNDAGQKGNAAMSSQKTKKGQGGDKKSAWFSLFADLDPLSNPDAVGKPEGDDNNPC